MDKIKASECEAGKWYEIGGMRAICVGPSNVCKGGKSFIYEDYSILNNRLATVTPLPDCTGWDWQPPPKYRPFKDAWEFVRAVDGRRLVMDGRERWFSSVDFSAAPAPALVVRFGPEWLSLKCLLERVKFLDTNEPCGVKL